MSTEEGIYLDYNATTPCDPRVLDKMLPYFSEIYGNPANGLHRQGRLSAKAIDYARAQVATLIGAGEKEIIFTSGATESNNLAILGIVRINHHSKRKRIVTSAIEHKAVLEVCKKVRDEGFDVIFLPVDTDGRVSIKAAREAINSNTLLVSVQVANNEIGTIQPIAKLAELAHHHGALFHCDAAQATGKIPVNVEEWDVDLLSISGHKLYGPKGIGALYIRGGPNSIPLEPIWYGGGQESGLRSGTSNVPSIVGFGEACHICTNELKGSLPKLKKFRDILEKELMVGIPSLMVNGFGAERLPNTSSLTIPGVDADALILNVPKIMLGTGSACTSGAVEPSHVLTAIGLTREKANSTIRISCGRFTQENSTEMIVSQITQAYIKLRQG